MLHKWQLVHSGGLNIFGLDKGVYNLTSVNTSETGYFFLIFLVSKFWPIFFFLNSKFNSHKKNKIFPISLSKIGDSSPEK
jgi:hypothetical protein